MQTLPHMIHLARFALAGFLVSLGVAVASPVVQPPVLEMVCSGGTYKLVQTQGAAPGGVNALDCPLCAPAGLPPAAPAAACSGSWGAGAPPDARTAPEAAAPVAGPPPARAPPDRSAAS